MDYKYSKHDFQNQDLNEASFIGSFVRSEDMPNDFGEICMIGRSNSGKSTLLSSLFKNSSIVKISQRPGSTKTINFFQLKSIYLVDLPGYGYARTSHQGRNELSDLISQYLLKRKNIKTAFLLLDCFRGLKEEELFIMDLMKERKIPLVLVLTKTDRLNQKEISLLMKKIKKEYDQSFFQVFPVSGKKKENLSSLYNFIRSMGAAS